MNLLIATALSLGSLQGEEMKLIHSTTGFVVVEFAKDGKATFHDRFLKAEMEEQGILIPEGSRKDFEGKDVIYLDDSLFAKAFVEIYYPLCIADPDYRWQK